MNPDETKPHPVILKYREAGYRVAAYIGSPIYWIEEKNSDLESQVGIYSTLSYRILEKPWVLSKGHARDTPPIVEVPSAQAFKEISLYFKLGGSVETKVTYLGKDMSDITEAWEQVPPDCTVLDEKRCYRAKELPNSFFYAPAPEKEGIVFKVAKTQYPPPGISSAKDNSRTTPTQLQLDL